MSLFAKNSPRRRRIRAAAGLAALLAGVLLFTAAPAQASYQLVKEFADSGEGGLNDSPGALAVNQTSGDVYEADGEQHRVLRFDSEGELLEAWGWGVADGTAEFQRCGPAGEPAHPLCEGRFNNNHQGLDGEGVGQFRSPQGVAVDQATGNVYVLDPVRQTGLVQEFTASGEFITGFGEAGAFQEPVSASPGKIHRPWPNGIAVAATTGDVYLLDAPSESPSESRVMVFQPESPGDYEHYLYAGQPQDLFHGRYATQLARDAAGDFYLATGEQIYRFDAGELAVPAHEFESTLGIQGMTVDPQSGRVFFYLYKPNKFRLLEPSLAPAEGGEFPGAVGPKEVGGIAFNPDLAWPGHPPGVLYATAPFVSVGAHPARALIFAPPPVFPPAVDSSSASSVATTSAVLKAQINAKGFDTHYRFQYVTEEQFAETEWAEATEAPLGGAELGSANEDQGASAALTGLHPETTYRWRVIATSHCETEVPANECSAQSTDATFTTFPAVAPGLPDNRAYELVSPADKRDGEVFPVDPAIASCNECEPGEANSKMPLQSAPDGESIVYEGYPFTASGGAVGENEYLAERTPSGWQTRYLTSPLEGRESKGFRAFSSDLSLGVLAHLEPPFSPEAPAGYEDLYLRAPDGALRPLLIAAPPHRDRYRENQANIFKLEFAAASADFTHIAFTANDALTLPSADAPEAPEVDANENNLYEWAGGELRLVNVLPGNLAAVPGGDFGSGGALKSTTEAAPDYNHAVSEDGSRIFWTDLASGQLYLREDGKTTREVPGSDCRVSLPQSSRTCFLTAAADGARVLLSDGHLRDLGTETLTDLTDGQGGFQGFLGASEDLSRVYFVDTAVLSEEENSQEAIAKAGADNLYLYDAGSGSPRFIATLLPADNESLVNGIAGPWKVAPSDRLARVSADGSHVAFMSEAPLTGYDNKVASGLCRASFGDASSTPACFEVFEWDAASGRLACASCDPTGLPPTGGSRLSLISPTGSRMPQPHYLAADGRLFFNSFDAISPHDVNGVQDVYEYEPAGVGTCARPAGCLALISSGHGAFDSAFLSADASGANAFFTTRNRLLPSDVDDRVDLYDARVGGGIAAETELAPPECLGEACQPAPLLPNDPTPASSAFRGAGNVVGKPAGKGHRKKHHRKRSHRRHHHRAGHNHGGTK